ncbi:MAG TPA: hydroxymethylbilane synthase [Phycisphaerae bacterium]|nr:hydroxymethylbilane synthase [Phycisphaerae bacterium]
MTTLPTILRLGTRGSLLARTQSQLVADTLKPFLPPGHSIELVTITTSGDKQQDKPLQDSGGKGLFVKELDESILAGHVDFTVHSAKDVPAERHESLIIAATPKREDPRDLWIGKDGITIENLPQGAPVGTASLRRQAQLLARRPDLHILPLRGNIDTRLRKVAEGRDGIFGTFLAAAGLKRTGLVPAHAVFLETDKFIPAAGQGTLAIEARRLDPALIALLQNIHDPVTAACLHFERQIVAALAGNCLAPIGVCAQPRATDPGWIVRAIVASPDGTKVARATLMSQKPGTATLEELQPILLQTLLNRGAKEILSQLPPGNSHP